jgi:hypothetical protein
MGLEVLEMVAGAFQTILLSVENGLSGLAALALCWAGGAFIKDLRQRRSKKSPSIVRAARRLRVGFRSVQVRHFRQIANQVADDAREMLAMPGRVCRVDQYEARTMIPLVTEARRFGESLLASRRRWHTFIAPRVESQVEVAILDLIEVESRLKAIPRSIITIEDVFAGRFE